MLAVAGTNHFSIMIEVGEDCAEGGRCRPLRRADYRWCFGPTACGSALPPLFRCVLWRRAAFPFSRIQDRLGRGAALLPASKGRRIACGTNLFANSSARLAGSGQPRPPCNTALPHARSRHGRQTSIGVLRPTPTTPRIDAGQPTRLCAMPMPFQKLGALPGAQARPS
jgi:hypothetical protein